LPPSVYTPRTIKKLYPAAPSAIYTDSSLFENGHAPLTDAFAASRPLFEAMNARAVAPTSGTSFPVAFIADQDEASRGAMPECCLSLPIVVSHAVSRSHVHLCTTITHVRLLQTSSSVPYPRAPRRTHGGACCGTASWCTKATRAQRRM